MAKVCFNNGTTNQMVLGKMLINSKSKIAVIALINLAKHSKREPIRLSELARIQGVSASYLEQIFAKLRGAGLVASVLGPGGGYEMPSTDVSIYQVVTAIRPNGNDGGDGWRVITEKIESELKGIKIGDLLG